MTNVLIIGAGSAGSVVTQKCAEDSDTFAEVHLASRRIESCQKIASLCNRAISTYHLDADHSQDVAKCILDSKATIVINMALPYQDLSIMDACLETGAHYIDTANYEPKDIAKFEYHWQWAYHDQFKQKGLMALLGSGFDPGVTNVFCAYAQKHLFDRLEDVDIVDCNAGDHGHPFATNFNPEINIREITQKGRFWEQGKWKEIAPLSVHKNINFPEIGEKKAYLIYHEEIESLTKHLPYIQRMRFWMTFSDTYLTHLEVLQNVGLTRIDPISYEGKQIVPLQFLKALLPDPSTLGENYSGKTCIGCMCKGTKDNKEHHAMIYNTTAHEDCYQKYKAQAVSFTTGVPAYIGASLIAKKHWFDAGVFNIEQLDPDPFMTALNHHGLPWKIITEY